MDTTKRFADTLECVHCGDEIEIPLSTVDGREDHWLHDGQTLTCAACGGVNRVCCDVETPAYLADCEDEHCAACAG